MCTHPQVEVKTSAPRVRMLQPCTALQPFEAHQKASLDSLEGLLVSNVAHNLVPAHHGERVADSDCLLQLTGPTHGHWLQRSKCAMLHRQHSMQLRLQSKQHMSVSGRSYFMEPDCDDMCASFDCRERALLWREGTPGRTRLMATAVNKIMATRHC